MRARSLPIRFVAGAAAGIGFWFVLRVILPSLPEIVRFGIGWWLFTFGPGAIVACLPAKPLSPLQRIIVALGAGSAIAPVIIDVLGRLNLAAVFPWLAAALGAVAIGLWTAPVAENQEPGRFVRGDGRVVAALVAFALVLGGIVFWHRLDTTGGAIVLYGDYDTADMGYYAAEASEASHTIPPTASYYSGHKLNAADHPHLVPAMVNRFAEVPVLSIYYRYAWPTFLALSAAAGFALVRLLASRRVAALAVVLLLIGGDLSWLAAYLLPHADLNWDFVLWPTNFLSPTMEVLHFSTWGPSMPVFLTVLFAFARGLQTRRHTWLLLGGVLFGILFEFKPFAYIVLMAALGGATVFSPGDWGARRRYAIAIAYGLLFAVPSIYAALTIAESDRRSRLLIDPFLLPKRMLIKTDLTDAFARVAAQIGSGRVGTAVFLAMASVVFLVVGIGVRWLGAPRVWRALRGEPAWRLLAWVVVAGISIPFVLATDPYVDTLQFHITGLYVSWIFVAAALFGLVERRRATGLAAVALVFALALPSSLHFLSWKWHEAGREPRVAMTAEEAIVARYLRAFDPETTVVLHDRPLEPSLTTIVAARRIVLGWDVRYSAVGGEERLRDVNRFYSSADGNAEAAFDTLRRYQVTHVIVRADDRVHPDVLSRLRPLLQLPGVALYSVPRP